MFERLKELTEHARKNGHTVALTDHRTYVFFGCLKMTKKIVLNKPNTNSLIDECCECLEGFAFVRVK